MAILEQSMETFTVLHDAIRVQTDEPYELRDITAQVRDRVRRSGVLQGQVTVQGRHGRTAILVGEGPAPTAAALRELLDRPAPAAAGTDDVSRWRAGRTAGDAADARARLRALALGCSQTLAVIDARLGLDERQRVFLAELDGPGERDVLLTVVGMA